VRKVSVVVVALTLLLTGYGLGRASEKDEAVVTVKVTSADHEVQEGYFSLGENTTVMVKPGSDLFRFLSRHRGSTITVTLAEGARRELSRLDR
jgi:hypothetical protein